MGKKPSRKRTTKRRQYSEDLMSRITKNPSSKAPLLWTGFVSIALLVSGCSSDITEDSNMKKSDTELESESESEFESKNDRFNKVLALAHAGDKQQLRQRLQQGKSIDVVDEKGRSAVLTVVMRNDLDALRLLIELGADVDFHDEDLSKEVIDQTAFLYAGAHGMNDALLLLIEAGAKPDIYNFYGGTALIPAAEKGHLVSVKLLLEKSAIDVDHVNRLGWTALIEAVVLSDSSVVQQQIIKQLLAHGADPSILDKDGVTALEHAMKRGNAAVVELLRSSFMTP